MQETPCQILNKLRSIEAHSNSSLKRDITIDKIQFFEPLFQ